MARIVPLKQHEANVSEINTEKWKVASQLGITKESLKANHPELVVMEEAFGKKVGSALKKGAITTALSGITAAAIPLFFKGRAWVKGLVAVVTGGAGAAVGGAVSVQAFGKPVYKDAIKAIELENAALDREITKKMQEATAPAPEGGQNASVPAEALQYAQALIKQRDPNFAAQATKEAEQSAVTVSVKY